MSKTAEEVIEGIFGTAAEHDQTAAITEAMRGLWRGGGWSPERILADASAAIVPAAETDEHTEVSQSGKTTSDASPKQSIEPPDASGSKS